MGVIATLSKIEESCPTELKPLQEFVDTDALDEFFHHTAGEDVSVTFYVSMYTVSVYGSGRITVSSTVEPKTRKATAGGVHE